MATHRKPILIRDVLEKIIRDRGLSQVNPDTYVNNFTNNLILDSEKLKEIPLDQLHRLNLPLFLEVCISKYIVQNIHGCPSKRPINTASDQENFSSEEISCPYLNALTACRNGSTVSHTYSDLWSSNQSMDSQFHNYNTCKSNSVTDSPDSMVLKCPQGIREGILNSWIKLTDTKSEDATKFFDSFYSHFLRMDPLNRKLFQNLSMKKRAQNLMKILKFVIANVSNPIKYLIPLRELAVIHLIYGVGERQFTAFSVALVKALEETLGDSITTEIKEAWFTLSQGLGKTMLNQYDSIRAGVDGKIYSLVHKRSWKLLPIKLTHEVLYVYSDAESHKVLKKISLNEVEDVNAVDKSETTSVPTEFKFLIVSQSKSYEFCCLYQEDLNKWVKDITCRVNVYKALSGADQEIEASNEEKDTRYKESLLKQMSHLRRLVLGSRKNL